MDFSPAALLASLVLSSAGYVLYRYGKREQRLPQLCTGLALMIGPYFTGGALATWSLGAVAAAALYAALRMGW